MRVLKKNRVVISRILLLVILVVIFIFSNQKGEDSSKMSNYVAETMKIEANKNWKTTPSTQPVIAGLNIRKIAHIMLYAFVGIFSFGAFSNIKNRWIQLLISIIISYFFAIFDEIHQIFVPGRTAGMLDVYMDSIGFITSIILCYILQFFYLRKNDNKINQNYESEKNIYEEEKK